MNKFLGNWENKEDVIRDFEVDASVLKGARIIMAWYGNDYYEGSAFVLFRRNKKLYEVNGSHCSCYGLEGQWDPEETSVQALKHRYEQGTFTDYYSDGSAAKDALLKYCSRRKS